MNDCDCKNTLTVQTGAPKAEPAVSSPARSAPERSDRHGACVLCLRKHLLKAKGYAEEILEQPNRIWEREQMLLNLMLAEDHALALEQDALKEDIRSVRKAVENGADPLREIRKHWPAWTPSE